MRSNAIGRSLAAIPIEHLRWLWQGRIPLGKFTLVDGDPDVGKSSIMFEIAARITRGEPMPFESTPLLPASGVVIVSEDAAEDIVKPRLVAYGADPERIRIFAPPHDLPQIPDESGMGRLELAINDVDAALLLLDPIVSFINRKFRVQNNDQHARHALAPIVAMAARTGTAIVGVRHCSKQEHEKAIHAGGGSIGIIGSAKAALLVTSDANDPDAGSLAVSKRNLHRPTPSLRFRFEEDVVTTDANEPMTVGVVRWLGESDETADDLVHSLPEGDYVPTLVEKAKGVLLQFLATGPKRAIEVQAHMGHHGFRRGVTMAAKGALGIDPERIQPKKGETFTPYWLWRLPAGGSV